MNLTDKPKVLLTEYSHGGGCGCKIAPQVLTEILKSDTMQMVDKNLLVGNSTNDDAAVYDLGDGRALISTTDFFMPIVDDAFDFGRVASANAISDVYAMGGTPTLALAILGWPVNTLSPDIAKLVIEGARSVCLQAGIPLAGGHSIDTKEPMFGLAVSGLIDIKHLKKNCTAKEGDLIFMTKALGTGIMATAQKRKLLLPEDQITLTKQLTTLNAIGEKLGKIEGVTAMTDITGFGLLGHLSEMAVGSGLSASIEYSQVPKMAGLLNYVKQGISPDASTRNWNAYSKLVHFEEGVDVAEAFKILPDPQTNGGILFSVRPEALPQIQSLLRDNGLEKFANPIGRMLKQEQKIIRVGN
ncbi:MAG: selenide, water dikinase SelD [bacterium]|nr:selenide, water dikinase SelD [bacterium]